MVYIYIDESGDTGELRERGASRDFAMAACVCYSENIEYMNDMAIKLRIRLKKKEIKFSKLSRKDIKVVSGFLDSIGLKYFSAYTKKSTSHHGEGLLKGLFQNLIKSIKTEQGGKVKVFIDGPESSYFRKIYEPIIRKRFPRATLRFVNSMKTPMIQVADFYAGYRRSKGK